jgi:aryl-alcohol dehydrogenase-like predicted oxidoreductase
MESEICGGTEMNMEKQLITQFLALRKNIPPDASLELALSFGVNHVDMAPGYGEAELRVGDWIARHGRPFFLATKTGERTCRCSCVVIRSILPSKAGSIYRWK